MPGRETLSFRSDGRAAVIGGGLYGLSVACALARRGVAVTVYESGECMKRASRVNQARIHSGGHYLRSASTLASTTANMARFRRMYRDSVCSEYTSLYLIDRLSSVSPGEFEERMLAAGSTIAKPMVPSFVDSSSISGCYEVDEFAFDVNKLRDELWLRAAALGVRIHEACEVTSIKPGLELAISTASGGSFKNSFDQVFMCLYSDTNKFLGKCGIPGIPLEMRMSEVVIVNVPTWIKRYGITVVDGPFWSAMPFPSMKDCHSLTHVILTHQTTRRDSEGVTHILTPRPSSFSGMVASASYHVPDMIGCTYVESLFETKAIPVGFDGDRRPTLVSQNHHMDGLHVVIGGKIASVFDLEDSIFDNVVQGDVVTNHSH